MGLWSEAVSVGEVVEASQQWSGECRCGGVQSPRFVRGVPTALDRFSRDEGPYPASGPLPIATLLAHRALRPTLHPHQKQAVAWMIQRERTPWIANSSKTFKFEQITPQQLGLQPALGEDPQQLNEPADMEMDDDDDGEQQEQKRAIRAEEETNKLKQSVVPD